MFDREGFKEYVRAWRSGFPDVYCEVDDLIVEGDAVAWSVRARGTHTGDFMGVPPTGNAVDFDSLNIGQVRDGRAYRHRVMMDIPEMMEQLGLGQGPTS
jgi:predicted ester cyclase